MFVTNPLFRGCCAISLILAMILLRYSITIAQENQTRSTGSIISDTVTTLIKEVSKIVDKEITCNKATDKLQDVNTLLSSYQILLNIYPEFNANTDETKTIKTLHGVVQHVEILVKPHCIDTNKDLADDNSEQSTFIVDKGGTVQAFSYIGAAYDAIGNQEEALNFYNRALPIQRELGDREGEVETLNNIGDAYDTIGAQEDAINFYNRALPIQRELGDREGEVETLNNIGDAYDAIGAQEDAINFYNRALPIQRELGSVGEATILNKIGAAYDAIGEQEEAQRYFNQARDPLDQSEVWR